jgi:hypothetical protein
VSGRLNSSFLKISFGIFFPVLDITITVSGNLASLQQGLAAHVLEEPLSAVLQVRV